MTDAGPDGEDDRPSAQETARYIADITAGVSVLARRAGLDVLAYLLDMARLEAEETFQKSKHQ
jgi:hypothetical protein